MNGANNNCFNGNLLREHNLCDAVIDWLSIIPAYPDEIKFWDINKQSSYYIQVSNIPQEAPLCEDTRDHILYLCWPSEEVKQAFISKKRKENADKKTS